MNNKPDTNSSSAFTKAARILSFLAALAVLALVVIYPRIIASDMHDVPHGWLVLTMFGMSFLFVYGIGFTPNHKLIRLIINPIVGWIAIIVGSWKVFF